TSSTPRGSSRRRAASSRPPATTTSSRAPPCAAPSACAPRSSRQASSAGPRKLPLAPRRARAQARAGLSTHPPQRSQRIALAVLTALTFLVVAWMASPMFVGLVLGTVLGFTAQPMYAHFLSRLRQKRTLAAALTTFLGGLAMAGGGAAVVWVAVR